ncbi:hypothetical protein ZV79_566 [Salmonella enterica subsp. enterica serovar Typhimurium]|nr:hypothetical protein ZV79_566 [Salmonella enterica subsp. enterica serovar Typhimurium]
MFSRSRGVFSSISPSPQFTCPRYRNEYIKNRQIHNLNYSLSTKRRCTLFYFSFSYEFSMELYPTYEATVTSLTIALLVFFQKLLSVNTICSPLRLASTFWRCLTQSRFPNVLPVIAILLQLPKKRPLFLFPLNTLPVMRPCCIDRAPDHHQFLQLSHYQFF